MTFYAGQRVGIHFQANFAENSSAFFDLDDIAVEICNTGNPPVPTATTTPSVPPRPGDKANVVYLRFVKQYHLSLVDL